MRSLATIVEQAQARLQVGLIVSPEELQRFFDAQFKPTSSKITRNRLDSRAVAAGLYASLGRRYHLALEIAVTKARLSIEAGEVRSEGVLDLYLADLARGFRRTRPFHAAFSDLKIEARQRGFYDLVAEKGRRKKSPVPPA